MDGDVAAERPELHLRRQCKRSYMLMIVTSTEGRNKPRALRQPCKRLLCSGLRHLPTLLKPCGNRCFRSQQRFFYRLVPRRTFPFQTRPPMSSTRMKERLRSSRPTSSGRWIVQVEKNQRGQPKQVSQHVSGDAPTAGYQYADRQAPKADRRRGARRPPQAYVAGRNGCPRSAGGSPQTKPKSRAS